jgi:hypothetical protein
VIHYDLRPRVEIFIARIVGEPTVLRLVDVPESEAWCFVTADA